MFAEGYAAKCAHLCVGEPSWGPVGSGRRWADGRAHRALSCRNLLGCPCLRKGSVAFCSKRKRRPWKRRLLGVSLLCLELQKDVFDPERWRHMGFQRRKQLHDLEKLAGDEAKLWGAVRSTLLIPRVTVECSAFKFWYCFCGQYFLVSWGQGQRGEPLL